MPSGGVGEAVITNTYAPFLRVTVTKQVTGGMGDTRRGFAFTAAIDGRGGHRGYPLCAALRRRGADRGRFTIPHKGSIVIGHLKPGQTVTVTEETLTDYETTIDDGSSVTLGSSYTATLTGDAAVTCVNNKDGVPPTVLRRFWSWTKPPCWKSSASGAPTTACSATGWTAPQPMLCGTFAKKTASPASASTRTASAGIRRARFWLRCWGSPMWTTQGWPGWN